MRNTFVKSLAAAGLLAVTATSQALNISLNPPSQAVTAGDSLSLKVVVSGLGAGTAPSLGGFDLDISFNSAVLSFVNAAFGDPVLGDQLDLTGSGLTTYGASASGGIVNLFGVSGDPETDLNNGQAGSFTLAVLNFTTSGGGASTLNITVNDLSDAAGSLLTADTLSSAIVTVEALPEPASIWLTALGLIPIATTGWRRVGAGRR